MHTPPPFHASASTSPPPRQYPLPGYLSNPHHFNAHSHTRTPAHPHTRTPTHTHTHNSLGTYSTECSQPPLTPRQSNRQSTIAHIRLPTLLPPCPFSSIRVSLPPSNATRILTPPPNHQLHQLFLFFPLFFRFILFLFCFFSSSTHHILLLQLLLLLLLLLLLHRLRRLCRLRCLSHSCLLQPLILIFLHPLLHFFFYYCFTSNSAYASINVAHCQLTRKHYLLRLSPFRLTPIPCC
ncbi:hypothetical protein TcWFU_004239 [Taenia crassiceps]|uniref:Uncharacterized protein n=1 Tax=Taenia crassiceps TaxID=6207 RepID=A0ABR4QAW1_9CEST